MSIEELNNRTDIEKLDRPVNQTEEEIKAEKENEIDNLKEKIRRAIKNSDIRQARESLKELEETFEESGKMLEDLEGFEMFLERSEKGFHWDEKIREGIKNDNVGQVRENLEKLDIKILDAKNLERAIEDLRGFSRLTIKSNGDEKISVMFIEKLGEVGKVSLEKADEEENEETKKGFEETTIKTIESLESVGKFSAKEDFEDGLMQSIKAIGETGAIIVEQEKTENSEKTTEKVIKILGILGSIAAEKKLEHTAINTMEFLENIEEVTINEEFKHAPTGIAISLEQIGESAAENKLQFATIRAISDLDSLGKNAIDINHGIATNKAARALEAVGKIALKNKIGNAEVSIYALINIGILSQEKKQNEDGRIKKGWEYSRQITEKDTVDSLIKLSKLNAITVKKVFEDMESKLDKSKHEFFQKFKKLYKEKLKEKRKE